MLSGRKNLDETEIFRICVILGIVGLMATYGSSLYIDLERTPVSDIERSWTGKNVMVSGEITEYRKTDGNIFFDLESDKSSIKVVMFDTSRRFQNGERVNVTGHVAIYQDELEIIAKNIES